MYFKLGKKKIGGDEREGPTYSSFLNFIGQRQKKWTRSLAKLNNNEQDWK